MGCLCSSPAAETENDPTITVKAEVGDIIISGRYSTQEVRGGCKGIMYVKDGYLYYQVLCCCCCCCKRQFLLSDITHIQTWNQRIEITLSNGCNIFVLVPDAAIFGPQLMKATGLDQTSNSNEIKFGLDQTSNSDEIKFGLD